MRQKKRESHRCRSPLSLQSAVSNSRRTELYIVQAPESTLALPGCSCWNPAEGVEVALQGSSVVGQGLNAGRPVCHADPAMWTGQLVAGDRFHVCTFHCVSLVADVPMLAGRDAPGHGWSRRPCPLENGGSPQFHAGLCLISVANGQRRSYAQQNNRSNQISAQKQRCVVAESAAELVPETRSTPAANPFLSLLLAFPRYWGHSCPHKTSLYVSGGCGRCRPGCCSLWR